VRIRRMNKEDTGNDGGDPELELNSNEGNVEEEATGALRNNVETIPGRTNGPPRSSYPRGPSRFGMRGRGRGVSQGRGYPSYSRGPPPYQSSPQTTHSTRVYVGNLSWHTSWQDLKDHMRNCGNVLHVQILKDENGRSKGCGIVEYNTPEEAEAAKLTLNDTKIGETDRLIFVREDREPPREFVDTARTASGRQVFIRNLPFTTHWRDLKSHFQPCGRIIRADTLYGSDGRPKGQGTILFESKSDAQKAIETFNNTEFQGRIIGVHEDRFF